MKRGFVHVYTGNGKGKTTAALGLAIRAAGAGLKVYVAQFLKGQRYSELRALDKYAGSIDVVQFGSKNFIFAKASAKDKALARRGLENCRKAMLSGSYNLIIMDEINCAIDIGIIMLDDLMGIIKNRPANVELVLTGRNAPKEIVQLADLVTEMKERRHYYNSGIKARKGIEY
jgi:cob(I)alamin adenosyltransferase